MASFFSLYFFQMQWKFPQDLFLDLEFIFRLDLKLLDLKLLDMLENIYFN